MVIKFEAKENGHLTGKDIIDFIQKHHLEHRTLYRTNSEDTCIRVFSIEFEDSEDDKGTFLVD